MTTPIDTTMNPARVFLTPWLATKERGDTIAKDEALSVAQEPARRWASVQKLIRDLMRERGMTVTPIKGGYKVDPGAEQVEHAFRRRRRAHREVRKAVHALATVPADTLTPDEVRRRDFGLAVSARDAQRFEDAKKELAALGRPEPKPSPRLAKGTP